MAADPAVVIALGKRKPMFGDKGKTESPSAGEETEGDSSLEDDAFLAFANAVADKDAKAMRTAWSALPCPATMNEEE